MNETSAYAGLALALSLFCGANVARADGEGVGAIKGHLLQQVTKMDAAAHDYAANAGPRQAFVPPSTVRFAPVIYDASGPATNATSAAISSTLP
jgi:hypothetical protein